MQRGIPAQMRDHVMRLAEVFDTLHRRSWLYVALEECERLILGCHGGWPLARTETVSYSFGENELTVLWGLFLSPQSSLAQTISMADCSSLPQKSSAFEG